MSPGLSSEHSINPPRSKSINTSQAFVRLLRLHTTWLCTRKLSVVSCLFLLFPQKSRSSPAVQWRMCVIMKKQRCRGWIRSSDTLAACVRTAHFVVEILGTRAPSGRTGRCPKLAHLLFTALPVFSISLARQHRHEWRHYGWSHQISI